MATIISNLKGATGNTGATGSTGAAGSNGTNGTNGTNGSKILTGSGVPSNGLGADGDIYIDTVTSNMYQKAAGIW